MTGWTYRKGFMVYHEDCMTRTRLARSPMRHRRKPSRTRVMPDGREVLTGAAWEQRKREVWELDEGVCQWKTPLFHFGTVRCGIPVPWETARYNIDHIVKRSESRDDRASNLRVLCPYHHRMRHEQERELKWSRHA